MSPVIFNVFINDLMQSQEYISGVAVPTGSQRGGFRSTLQTAGALFADDAVGLSPDLDGVRMFCDRVSEWCETNEMEVGIRKCGVMEFLPDPTDVPILTEDHPHRGMLRLSEHPVPIVTKYKYLGLGLTPELKISDIVRSRHELGRKTVSVLVPFLRCPVLPLSMRWQVLRAVVLPRLLFGAELYGMNRLLTDSMQSLLSKCLRAMAGIQSRQTSSVALMREFSTPPICALAAGRRARAYAKCFQLTTTVGLLVLEPLKVAKRTWVSGTVTWIRRCAMPHFHVPCRNRMSTLEDGTINLPAATSWGELPPQELRDWVVEAISHRERTIRLDPRRSTGPATLLYVRSGFEDTRRRLTKARVFSAPKDHWGIALVLQARIGAFPLAPALAEAKRLHFRFKRRCPFCRRREAETLHHLFFKCRAWRQSRRDCQLQGTLAKARSLVRRYNGTTDDEVLGFFDSSGMSNLTSQQLAVSWVLGGTCGAGWGVAHYMPPPPTTRHAADEGEDNISLSSSSSSEEDEAAARVEGNEELPHLFRVGRFLAAIVPLRRRILRSQALSIRRGQGTGATATTPGQSLVG